MRNWFWIFTLLCSIALGCGDDQSRQTKQSSALRLAVTTSTRDSGLLDELIPIFEQKWNVRVDVIAVGTGKALRLGEAGDVDVVLVHARDAENAFLLAGHGVRREDVMYNTFEILGPPDDPAGIAEMEPVAALKKIANGNHRYLSRGDESGTHQRELLLWKKGGGRPLSDEYIESGRGMGATLIMAGQMKAYVLTDRGTYLRFKKKIELKPLVSSSGDLKNPYGILVVNPNKHSSIRNELADAFVDFIISQRVQQIIQDFTVDGEQLFYPLRLTNDD